MRTIEVALLGASGVVIVLRSPTARQAAARGVVRAGRAAGPVAARAAGRAGQSASRRYSRVRESWADRSPARPVSCLDPDCDWTQERPSSAELLEHLRTAHRPAGDTTPAGTTGTAPAPAPPGPVRLVAPVDDRPAERITEVAPGVRIGHQITEVIDQIGLHMDEFRAVSRALAHAGEIEPKSLLGLLNACTGLLTSIAGVSALITDVAEHADTTMWVDLRAVGPLYEAAAGVMAEGEAIRRAMKRIQDLYAEEIAVEHKQDDGKVRPLNPQVVNAA
ncbi:hypothetical protein OG271_04120 [Micromonospora rifamycinica]|uniref:hypothetical protein n=1 Tax=Micromonospora rifamycinica TaxID=291594 RepID=UPI002E2E5A7D|nr:hypothetical protein [Micromonospora rifamycinica]